MPSHINNEWASTFVTAGVLDIVQTFSGTEETKNFCMTLRHEGNLDFSHRSLTPLASNVDGMAQREKKVLTSDTYIRSNFLMARE